MLTYIVIAAVAMAQQYGRAPASSTARAVATAPAPVSVAIPGRTLKDLPGTTVSYYDVAGKTGPAIDTSLKKMLEDPAMRDATRLLSWKAGTSIVKRTQGTTCTIQSAKSTLTGKVQLPRLVEEAKVKADVKAGWTRYIAEVENDAAASLWFLYDRLRGAEQSLVGLPCDQANAAWNAKLESAKLALDAFKLQRAQPASKPAA